MRRFGLQQWVMLAVFALAVAFVVGVGTRTVRRGIYWHYHRDEPIRPWMSVPYVAHSYRVPRQVLYQAIGLPPGPPRDRRPLREIARQQQRDVKALIGELQEAISRSRQPDASSPRPSPAGGRSP